jgi:hypothetical protein
MKSLKSTTIILSLVVFSLILGVHLTASADSGAFLNVSGTVTRDGAPVQGCAVVVTNEDNADLSPESDTTKEDGTYIVGFFVMGDVAKVGDTIKVVATPGTGDPGEATDTYQDAYGDTMTINVELPSVGPTNKGTVTLASAGPPTWTYTLTWEEGSLTQWTYRGALIDGASVAAGSTAATGGWAAISQTATEVVFETSTAMTSGEVTGFEISGTVEGPGSWECHDSSGNVEGPLPVTLSGFTAYYNAPKSAVTLKWSTASEVNNLGFDIYRSESPDGKFVKISPAYIKGAGTDSTPHDYQFVDESAVVGKTYYYYLEAISFSGERDRSYIIKVIIDASGKMKVTGLMHPTAFALLQNFPNPFNPETWIPFHLAETADVTIRIFDIKGQELRTIHLGQMPAGYYDTKGKAALWDGKDSYGQGVSSGIYFYHLTAGNFHATRKLTIIK